MKKTAVLLLALAMLVSLAACGASKLSDEYVEADVIARAEALVGVINTKDYPAVVAELRDDLEASITAEQLESAWGAALDKAGAFVSFSKEAAAGQKSESSGENYAVVVLVCKYENSTLTYTVSMDRDLEIVGMYMK